MRGECIIPACPRRCIVAPLPLMTASLIAPRRVLVIRLQNHGDVLLTTPIFSALKRHFPGVEVDALVFAETVPIISANPDLTHVWPMPRGKQAGRGMGRAKSFFELLRNIRNRRYDWVLHLNDQWSGAAAALVSGARMRFSFEMAKRDYWVWKRTFNQRFPATAEGHMVEQNLRILRKLGVPIDGADGRCTMAFSPEAAELAKNLLRGAGVTGEYILIHPTSRWFFKCWEDDRFAEIISALANAGKKVVLTSGPDARELEMVDALLSRVPHSNAVSIAGQLTLQGLAAAIAGAKLFIGVDSVPMHMAAALDVPLVALFGPTHVHIWRPWSDKAEVIHAAKYGPLIAPNDVNTATQERYLGNIPVEPVLEAVWRQLER